MALTSADWLRTCCGPGADLASLGACRRVRSTRHARLIGMTPSDRLVRATRAYVSALDAIANYFKPAEDLDLSNTSDLEAMIQRLRDAEREYAHALESEGFAAPHGLLG